MTQHQNIEEILISRFFGDAYLSEFSLWGAIERAPGGLPWKFCKMIFDVISQNVNLD